MTVYTPHTHLYKLRYREGVVQVSLLLPQGHHMLVHLVAVLPLNGSTQTVLLCHCLRDKEMETLLINNFLLLLKTTFLTLKKRYNPVTEQLAAFLEIRGL